MSPSSRSKSSKKKTAGKTTRKKAAIGKKAARKTTAKKKATGKKSTTRKTARKTAGKKTTAKKKAARKPAAKKKSAKKKPAAKKSAKKTRAAKAKPKSGRGPARKSIKETVHQSPGERSVTPPGSRGVWPAGPRPIPRSQIMTDDSEELNEALAHFEEDVRNVDEDDIEYAAKKGPKKLADLASNIPRPLQDIWNDLRLMVSCVRDYWTGAYRELPWKTIAAMTGAIVYLVTPVDVIPDFVPLIGYVDDAAVLTLALRWVRADLEVYRGWKERQEAGTSPAE